MPRNKQNTPAEQRPSSRDLRVLKQLFTFMRPYRGALLAAALALLAAAMAVLGFGVVLQQVVDHGLSSGSATALNQALLLFLIVITVMAASSRPSSFSHCVYVIRPGSPLTAFADR